MASAPMVVPLSSWPQAMGTARAHWSLAGGTRKSVGEVPTPAMPVTRMGPVTTLAGAVAVIWVAEFTVKGAATPPNATCEVPTKLLPLMMTTVPAGPRPGVKAAISGA